MKKEKIAIIGAGITGLSCAYFLHDKYDITVFEKNKYAGGHSNTTTVTDSEGQDIAIDTAVMIFNQGNYPYFWHLLQELKVPTHPVTSTIGFQHVPSGLEYAVPERNAVFAQWRNIFNVPFWLLVRELLRFGKTATEVLDDDRCANMTVEAYAKEKHYSQAFMERYLLPLTAALWSAEPQLIKKFPIVTLVRYFDNHHMLREMPNGSENAQYAWQGIVGGTQVYRNKLVDMFPKAMELSRPAKGVRRTANGAEVTDANNVTSAFDRVILACHADEALALLSDATPLEKELLSPFYYKQNPVALHTDASVMPKTKRAWASFNSRLNIAPDGNLKVAQNYYLNPLQNLPTKTDYFLAIGTEEGVDPAKILQRFSYSHPVYSVEAAQAQKRLNELNVNGRTYFCGSYFRYAFHEDAFVSALAVCRAITGEKIWGELDRGGLIW